LDSRHILLILSDEYQSLQLTVALSRWWWQCTTGQYSCI